jgi:hypothetical protein
MNEFAHSLQQHPWLAVAIVAWGLATFWAWWMLLDTTAAWLRRRYIDGDDDEWD